MPAMGETHVYDITMSPKGQVATVRCTCGWVDKCRSSGGAAPRDLARASGEGHVRGHHGLQQTSTSPTPLEETASATAHAYAFAHQRDGAVLSRCSCGWRTTFRSYPGGPPAADLAKEASDRHVRFHTTSSSLGPRSETSGASSSNAGLAGSVIAAAFVLFLVWALVSACSGAGDDEPDGPSGKYSETECVVLKYEATGDGAGADDAMVEYSIHCD
jgi:hypothetical protein